MDSSSAAQSATHEGEWNEDPRAPVIVTTNLDLSGTLESTLPSSIRVVSNLLDLRRALVEQKSSTWLLDTSLLEELNFPLANRGLLPLPPAPGHLLLVPDLAAAGRSGGVVVYMHRELSACIARMRELLSKPRAQSALSQILGTSRSIEEIRAAVRRIAMFEGVPVLLLGETGTGKELVANAIHDLSARGEPLISLNCAAIPETLFESELFGHEPGAFTDARVAKAGLLEAAGSGTLFLDEIGEMPLTSQPKLLRCLEARKFRRLGSNTYSALAARIVSATNRPSSISGMDLRRDLLFRLAGFTIDLPPLRARREDIPILANHFLSRFWSRHRHGARLLTDGALGLLHEYDWPGNLRELRHTVEHAAILSPRADITADVLRRTVATRPGLDRSLTSRPPKTRRQHIPVSLKELEKQTILAAYENADRNISKAARELGMPRSTVRAKIRRYEAD